MSDAAAAKELRVIGRAIARDAADYFQYGKFQSRKVLANGYVVTVEIREPTEAELRNMSRKKSAKKKPAAKGRERSRRAARGVDGSLTQAAAESWAEEDEA